MRRRLLLCALVLNLGLAGASAIFWARGLRGNAPADFTAFYTGGAMVLHGEGAALYDFEAQARRQRAVRGGEPLPGGLVPYLNPPHVAVLLAPLCALPLRPAFWLWCAAQLTLLAWVLSAIARDRPPLERWVICSAVAAAPPVLLTLHLGAFSLLILAAILAIHRALGDDRDRAAGAWLAVGSIKPQLVVGPALALLIGRRWRAVAAALVVTLVPALLAVAICGPRIWLDFAGATSIVLHAPERAGLHPGAMYNFAGTVRFFGGAAVRPIVPALALGGFMVAWAAMVWIWRGFWHPGEARFDLRMATTVLLGSFFSLHLYPQDGLLVVAAALMFDAYLRRAGRPRRDFAVLALLTPALWFLTELAFYQPWLRYGVALQLVLGVWLLRAWRSAPRQ